MLKEGIYLTVLDKIIYSKRILRPPLMNMFLKRLHKELVEENRENIKEVNEKKYQWLVATLECALRNIDKGYISRDVMKRMMKVFVRNALLKDQKKIDEARKKYGVIPGFIVLSPTSKCNLHCTGCYAAVPGTKFNTLPYDVVDRICDECYNKFNQRFMTISGGEPFLYRDSGKTLFDIWKKYDQMFFLVYTNGHFITPEAAKKLAELGNVTVAISVEGMEKETDERRGKGAFRKVMKAFKNLRDAGVPFGISVTTTKKNVDILLTEEFYDFYFKKQGVSYMWQFQIMPVGHGARAMELTITPEQRLKLYRSWEKFLKEDRYSIADFWNSGVLSDGCVAYAKDGGYLYINWDGKITPCVFVPYWVHNINDLYAEGKSIVDAINSDFFKRGREWQSDYKQKKCNWLMPCSIRDNARNWRKNIATKDIKPENSDAEAALKSEEYWQELEKFDEEIEKLTLPIWEEEYLGKKKAKVAPKIRR